MAAQPSFGNQNQKPAQLSLVYLCALFFYLLLILGCVLKGKMDLIPAMNACFLGLVYVAIAILYEQLREQTAIFSRRLDILEDRIQATQGADAVQNIFDRERRQHRKRDDPEKR